MKVVPIHNRITQAVLIPATLIITLMTVWFSLQEIKNNLTAFQQHSYAASEQFSAKIHPLTAFQKEDIEALSRNLMNLDYVAAIKLTFKHQAPLHFGPDIQDFSHIKSSTPINSTIRAIETTEYLQIHLSNLKHSKQPYTLIIDFDKAQLRIDKLTLIITNILLVLTSLVILHWCTNKLSHRATAPMGEMLNCIQKLTDGKLETRLDIKAQGEFNELQEGINKMALALESAHNNLQKNTDQATRDLQESNENLEVRAIQLDMAHKKAIEAGNAKTAFLANMSHEIRTPLNAILGFARVLEKNNASPEQLDNIRTIISSSDSLLAIINDVLDFSKIEAGHVALELNHWLVRDLVDDVVNLVCQPANAKHLDLAAIIYEDVPNSIQTDCMRLKQILTNLLSNAVKFTDSGSVIVRVELDDETDEHSIIKFSVTDSGIGLSDIQQKSLFQAFNQADTSTARKFGGTGLGLAISKRLTEKMGGDIGIISEINEGATFWFTIKCKKEQDALECMQPMDLSHEHIHLVEDNNHQKAALISIARQHNCQMTIHNSMEALIKHENIRNGQVIIAAEALNKQSYFQQIKHIRELQYKQLWLLTTDQAQQAQWQARDLFDHVLTKPLSSKRFVTSIQNEPTLAIKKAQDGQLNVLAVDDNAANLKLLKILLMDCNCHIILAEDGLQAVQQCEAQIFDLIFMDIQMPNLDGLQASKQIRLNSQNRSTPIVALTAHAMADEKTRILKEGMDAYLTKPVSFEQIKQTITQFCGEYILPDQEKNKHIGNQDTSKPKLSALSHHIITAQKDEHTDSKSKAPVDLAVDFKAHIALERSSQKEDLAIEMMNMMLEDLPKSSQTLKTLLDTNDYKHLEAHIHKIHGATRYCGLINFQNQCHQCESLLKQGEFDRAREAINELITVIDNIIQWAKITPWQGMLNK